MDRYAFWDKEVVPLTKPSPQVKFGEGMLSKKGEADKWTRLLLR